MLVKYLPSKVRYAYKRDLLAGALVGLYTGSIFPFFLIIARDRLDASTFLISLMTAAPFIGNLLALLWANAMEGRPKLPFVVWSGTIARSLMFLMVIATTPLRFALIICSSQFLGTIASPAYAAIMKDIYPDNQRGRIMGYVRVALALSTIVATLAAGILLADGNRWIFPAGQNYRWLFPVAALFGIGASISFSRIPTSPPSEEECIGKRKTHEFLIAAFAILADNRRFRWFALSVFTFGFGNLLLVPLYPVFQVDRLHITTYQAAILSNVLSIVWMASYLYWGRYVDLRSPLRATLVNVFLSMLVPINYFLAHSVWMLLPAFVISGVTAAGIELAYFNSILKFAEERRESHYQALFSWLLGVRGSVAPFIGAGLASVFNGRGWDIRYIFLIGAFLMLCGAMMQFLGVRRTQA